MKSTVNSIINANGLDIRISSTKEADYISLTDIAKKQNPDFPADVVKNWLCSRNTIEFLGLWEQLNNPSFKLVEFEAFKNQAGLNGFTLSPKKWIAATNAIGITFKAGRYGGTYAHADIAFEFASWISPAFKLYIIKEGLQQDKRLEQPNQIAQYQMKSLLSNAPKSIERLKELQK